MGQAVGVGLHAEKYIVGIDGARIGFGGQGHGQRPEKQRDRKQKGGAPLKLFHGKILLNLL